MIDVQETLAEHTGVEYERAEELLAEAKDRSVIAETDPSDRFSSIFHDSDTGSNMSVSDSYELVTCWRHNCSHGGLQALAVLSNVAHVSGFGCADLGAVHKHSGAGPNRLKGDW